MNKKSQGLSLNVIIIAIIALLVLIVLAVVFFISNSCIQWKKSSFSYIQCKAENSDEFDERLHECEGRYLEWYAHTDITGEYTFWSNSTKGTTYCIREYEEGDNPFYCYRCEIKTHKPKPFCSLCNTFEEECKANEEAWQKFEQECECVETEHNVTLYDVKQICSDCCDITEPVVKNYSAVFVNDTTIYDDACFIYTIGGISDIDEATKCLKAREKQ